MDTVIGKTCPYCQTPIKPGAPVVVCSACGMPHHTECWQENGRCTTFGCNGGAAGAGVQAAPAVQRTRDGHAICPVCEYVMSPFDATCPRCENMRRLGRTPGPPVAQPPAQPYGSVPPPQMTDNPQAYSSQYINYDEIRRWNWGAFALPLFWSAAMNQWLWFALCFVPCVSIVVPFYLGIKGNELAWESRTWASYSHFKSTQDVWNKWGIAIFIIVVILYGIEIIGISSGTISSSGY